MVNLILINLVDNKFGEKTEGETKTAPKTI